MTTFEQWQVDLCKQKFRSYKDNPPYMKLVFDLEDGTQQSIETPAVYKIQKSNAFNQVGRASIEIISVNGKYNYKLDPEWKGILDKRHQKITIIEGYGNWREVTFKGYITTWSMEADGESEIIVKIECVNKLLDINKSMFKGMGFDGSQTLDEISKSILDQAQYDIGAQEGLDTSSPNYQPPFSYDVQPYTAPTGDFSTTELNVFKETWEPVARVNEKYGGSGFDITRGEIVVRGYIDNGYMRVRAYDLQTLKDVTTDYNLDGFRHNKPRRHTKSIYANQRRNTVVIIGKEYSVYTTNWKYYDDLTISIIDLDKKEWKNITIQGYLPRVRDGVDDVVFYDNEIYLVGEDTLYKTVVDYENGTAEWQTLSNLGFSSDDYNDLYSRASLGLFLKGSEVVASVYLPEGSNNTEQYYTKYYDFITGEELRTLQGVGFYGITDYNGYGIRITADYYEVADLDFIDQYQTYTYNFPDNSPYTYGKQYAVFNNHIYMFPMSTLSNPDGTYDFMIHKTKIKFSNSGDYLSDSDTNYNDYLNQYQSSIQPTPSQNLFEQAQQELNSSYQTEIPSLSLLKEITEDSGKYLYTPSYESQILSVYPTAKTVPDYTFESSVDTVNIKHTKASDIYDRVVIYYGKGKDAGMVEVFRTKEIYPGMGGSVHKIMKPHLNREQAENYGKRVIENGIAEELEVAVRAVPNLTIGMTVLERDNRMVGDFKGVIMQEETDNSLDGGYYAKYKLLKFEG